MVGLPVIVGLYGLLTAGYLAGPLARLLLRRRGSGSLRRRGSGSAVAAAGAMPVAARRSLRRVTIAGVATAVGLNAAIGALVGVAFAGGPAIVVPVSWLGIRLSALATVALGAAAVVSVAAARSDGWRPSGVERVALIGTGTATGAVLVLATYWDLFTPRW